MWIKIFFISYAVYMIVQECCGLNFLELPGFNSDPDNVNKDSEPEKFVKNDDAFYKEGFKSSDTSDTEDASMQGARDSEYDSKGPRLKDNNSGQRVSKSESSEVEAPEKQAHGPRMIPMRTSRKGQDLRRHWLVANNPEVTDEMPTHDPNDKDASLKAKINTLVQQTMHDTELTINNVKNMKEENRDKAPYKIGFILSLVKKSRDVLNELFNVAVKHRDEWKALEQLKIFEMIVHTNVDSTNLVRQLVEIHIQNLNSTGSGGGGGAGSGSEAKDGGAGAQEAGEAEGTARGRLVLL